MAGPRIERARFGTLPDGVVVDVITIRNRNGITVRAMTYGGIILSLETPDRDGKLTDIVLGFDALEGYLGDTPYFGAIIGRYGNRIAKGLFAIDGATFTLAKNNGPNHLHGGLRGFDKVVWKAATFEHGDAAGVELTYTSADGEEGYPGRLDTTVTYTLDDDDALTIDYLATTSAATVVNLTQHSYFNLDGAGGSVADHALMIDADAFIPVDEMLIPLGVVTPVSGTPLDFRVPTPIGARIDASDPQLLRAGGYDHTFVVRGETTRADAPRVVARATSARSGRVLEVATSEPGVQLYTGNFLNGTLRGKSRVPIPHRGGFCLETQHFPDSPNQPAFPSTVLRPGETYRSRTVFRFSVER